MSALVFPTLPGQGWSVHKKPSFSTIVADHVSGREVRAAKWLNPRWDFELIFDGLDSSGVFVGLGAQSLQALMGFFMQTQGSFLPFVYYDPSDYRATNQSFGTGDGVTRAFQLQRTLGAATEWVTAPFAPSAPTLFQLAGAPAAYAPNNLINYSGDVTNAAWGNLNLTVSGAVADPFGGATARTLTATASGYIYRHAAAAGANYVSSVWLRRSAGSGPVYLRTPNNANVAVTPTSVWQRFSMAGAPAAGLAWSTMQISTAGDAVDYCAPQLEQSLGQTPGPYAQTLASAYYGGPQITVAGALVDPSTYAIANGVVTFGSAPANGAALAWSGYFGFLCRFDADDLDFEQFMSGLWQAASVKFKSVRAV